MTAPHVSVVIPYYEQQAQLSLVLQALDQQVGAPPFEIVVADDGSGVPPVVRCDAALSCSVVRQSDLGFRAASARNLGAAAATGAVLVFLDSDTLPAAGYLAAMARAVALTDDGHGVLVVGRRRHFHPGTSSTGEVLRMLRDAEHGVPPGIQDLGEPNWLADGLRRTADLHRAGDEDFRLVISAVLAVDRTLWETTGGFDGTFVGYGGEDWDFGWRAWLSGADWHHEPSALAWHDGPDAGTRGIDRDAKNAETLRLAGTIPLPSARGTGLVHPVPAIAMRYLGATTGTAQDAPVIDAVASWLDNSDAGVWFPACARVAELPPLLRHDPRVHPGEVPARVSTRAVHSVDLHRPSRPPGAAAGFCARGDQEVLGWVREQHTRRARRGAPIPILTVEEAGLQPVPPQLSLERRWGGW